MNSMSRASDGATVDVYLSILSGAPLERVLHVARERAARAEAATIPAPANDCPTLRCAPCPRPSIRRAVRAGVIRLFARALVRLAGAA